MNDIIPKSAGHKLLVVDDEPMICKVLKEFLELEGFDVTCAGNGKEAIDRLRITQFEAVITDLKMPIVTGLDLLDTIKSESIDTLTIVMTGYGTVETAIKAMKRGAYDYVLKPFVMKDVLTTLRRGIRERGARVKNAPEEARSILKVAQAMSSNLGIDDVLDIILSAAIDESDADAASIHLRDPKTDTFSERLSLNHTDKSGAHHSLPTPHHQELLSAFDAGRHIVAEGQASMRYFTETTLGKDLQSYASFPLVILGKTFGHLNVFSFTKGKAFTKSTQNILRVLSSKAATSIENAQLFDDLVTKNKALTETEELLESNYQQTVLGFAQALEESDLYTRGHSERVSIYAGLIAEGLSLPPEETRTIVRAGLMHDIGKLGLRYEMLNKPGPLNRDEKILFKEHPLKGKRILEHIPCMQKLVDAAWCHHEFFNGGGYPRGLSGHEIPLSGRIVQVADAYDAMTSDRAYRRALSHEIAIRELTRCAGTQFDPEIIEVFLRVIESYRKHDLSNGGEITLGFLKQFENKDKRSVV